MVLAAIYSVTLAVAARQLQDTGCPCLTSAPSGTSYPTFTLAGKTITYDNPPGELRVIPKPQTADVSPRSRSLYSGPRHRAMALSFESAPSAAQATVSPHAQPTTRASRRTAIVGASRRRGALIIGATWTRTTATNPSSTRSSFLSSATATSRAAPRTRSMLGSAPLPRTRTVASSPPTSSPSWST